MGASPSHHADESKDSDSELGSRHQYKFVPGLVNEGQSCFVNAVLQVSRPVGVRAPRRARVEPLFAFARSLAAQRDAGAPRSP